LDFQFWQGLLKSSFTRPNSRKKTRIFWYDTCFQNENPVPVPLILAKLKALANSLERLFLLKFFFRGLKRQSLRAIKKI